MGMLKFAISPKTIGAGIGILAGGTAGALASKPGHRGKGAFYGAAAGGIVGRGIGAVKADNLLKKKLKSVLEGRGTNARVAFDKLDASTKDFFAKHYNLDRSIIERLGNAR